MSASGQVAETFPLLRSCLEYALYAVHVNINPDLAEIWMRRHEDEASLKKCRRSFKYASVIETLEKIDEPLFRVIVQLYERTIDFGAHPNERALSTNLRLTESDDSAIVRAMYLQGDSPALDHALAITEQIGLGALVVFQHIFGDRMRKLGIDIRLKDVPGTSD